MSDPQPPALPEGAPQDLRDWVSCRSVSVNLGGLLDWLPISVTVTVRPGERAGTATITVDLGMLGSYDLPATIDDAGRLHVDTSSLPMGSDVVDAWIRDLNAWLKHNGQRLQQPDIRGGRVTLTKQAIPVPPPPAGAATPPTPPPAASQTGGTSGPDGSSTSNKGTGCSIPFFGLLLGLLLLLAAGTVLLAGGFGFLSDEARPPSPSPSPVANVPQPTPASRATFTPAATSSPSPGRASATAPASPDATPTGVSPSPNVPRLVSSNDGLVRLTIPVGALPADVPVRVVARGAEELPPELSGIPLRSVFYGIEPADALLSEPATYQRQVDLGALGIDPEQIGFPVMMLALRSSEGLWSWPADQEVSWVGGPLLEQEAMLAGFGDVFGFSGTVFMRQSSQPPGLAHPVGQPYTLRLALDYADALAPASRPSLGDVFEPFMSTAGVVAFGTPVRRAVAGRETVDISVTCQQAGDWLIGASYDVLNMGTQSPLFAELGLPPMTIEVYSGWTVQCTPPPAGFTPLLDRGCVSVVHSPLGAYPSQLEWLFGFSSTSTFPPQPTLSLSYREGTARPLVFADIPLGGNQAAAATGITSYGVKRLEQVVVHGADGSAIDITSQALEIFGRSTTVTSAEGVLAGNGCSP